VEIVMKREYFIR